MGQGEPQRGGVPGPAGVPDSRALVEVYREQCQHIQHLRQISFAVFAFSLSLILAILAATETGIAAKSATSNLVHLFAFALAVGGAHHLIATTTSIWTHLAIRARVERSLGLTAARVVPASAQFAIPASFSGFVWAHFWGSQGPFLLAYSGAGWLALFLSPLLRPLGYGGLAMAASPVLLAFMLSLVVHYNLVKAGLLAWRRETELDLATPERLAEAYCRLGEALMGLNPPRLHDALWHFEKALEVEPGHARAQEWVDKMRAWRG